MNLTQSSFAVPHPVFLVVLVCAAYEVAESATLATPAPAEPMPTVTARASVAHAFAGLIEQSIPREYEKRKDWGKTKNITVGIRTDGIKLSRRKKPVKHGVWKHYRVQLVEPENSLDVRIEKLRVLNAHRIGFSLVIAARLETWMRAKVYQYGVHVIALEAVGDTTIELNLDCEVRVQLVSSGGDFGVTIDPQVRGAQLNLTDFHLRRVSNARGPIIQELSSGLRQVVEHELNGPKLVAKVNRAIDKRRDRLSFSVNDLFEGSWWPLAGLPAVTGVATNSVSRVR